jgi:glucose/mannose transport system substrate-binding protein
MMRVRQLLMTLFVLVMVVAMTACAAPAAPSAAPADEGAGDVAVVDDCADPSGKLEIFSWWTSGGEVEALQAEYDILLEQHPNIEIENAALASGQGQGGNMKALLETRMMGNEPPDSFQVHLGRELIDSHVIADRMEPLDFLYEEEGWYDTFAPDVIEIASYEGHPYSVPVNIHRSNVMWYRPSKLADGGWTDAPTTWDEFFQMAEDLKAVGIPAIGIAEQGSGGGFAGHIFENILVSVMGPEKYNGLFDGTVGWDDPDVTSSLEIMDKLFSYANPDYASTSWGDINDRFIADDGPATIIMGDWTQGVLMSKGFEDYHWAPVPGTDGIFMVLSDSFGLPKDAPNRCAAIAFLKVIGSKAGQDAFNPIKGSIPARIDGDPTLYNAYLQEAMEDFKVDIGTPSIQHGAAAKQSFLIEYDQAFSDLGTNHDVARAQDMLVAAAANAGFGE